VITQDVLPFSMVVAPRGTRCYGINGVVRAPRRLAGNASRPSNKPSPLLLRSKLNTRRRSKNAWNPHPLRDVQYFIQFIESATGRGLTK